MHQDRLIKKMRGKKIASYEAANQYLQKQYLPEHNRRFARPSTSPEDYHGRKPTARELHEIFRLETERSISNDWVIQHKGRSLQLKPGSRHYGPRQSKAWFANGKTATCRFTTGASRLPSRSLRNGYRRPLSCIRQHRVPS